MKVYWSDFASKTLRDIYVYYKEVAEINIAGKIRSAIFSATKQLARYPNSGKIEDNLKILGEDHRYLIKGNYKIIYKPVKEGLLVTDVFDTRQDPQKITVTSRKTKK
jgi:plasmid stabilization system protein ParE